MVLMKNSNKNRVLIVEDNEIYLKMLGMRLKSRGHYILTANDGLEGLNMIRKEVPDLIILDIMLPLMDGHKVCRLVKHDRKVQHIPIVILTSRDLEADAEKAKKFGADAFIVKSTRSEVILDVVDKLLDAKKG